MTLASLLRAVVVASACCLVLATSVYVAIDLVRIKVVESPVAAANGMVHVRTADSNAEGLEAPFAVIARIHNASPAPERFAIRIDNQIACAPTVPGAAVRRLDCALARNSRRTGPRDVVIEGPDAAWRLEYLELATHHGNSTTPLALYIVPAASERYTRCSTPAIAAAFVLIAGVFLLPPAASRFRAVTWGSRAVAAFAVALFGIALVSPVLSPYRILLSTGTFAGWLAASLAPRLWTAGRWSWHRYQRAVQSWPPLARLQAVCRIDERRLAWLLAAATCAAGVVWGTRALHAADTYGYVSQADLWLRGNLTIDQAFAKQAPWPQPEWTFAPLGYRPSPVDDRLLVPIYSPGLPMLLAVAKGLGGQAAMFFVVPLCAGVLVLATYGIGRRLGAGWAGVAGAWLVATSPVVLFHTFITMSDVPAAAAWSAAFYLATGPGVGSAAAAGLLSGVAILIRPNLAPLAAILGLLYVLRARDASRRRFALRDAGVFATAVLPGVAAVAAINWSLFGSPLVSGYGSVTSLFAWERVPVNLAVHLKWLIRMHTPAVLLGLVAIFFPLRRLWPGLQERAVLLVAAAFVAVTWASYLGWFVYDSWPFARFLLPSWPFIMLGIGAVAAAVTRAASRWAGAVIVCAVVGLGLAQTSVARSKEVFDVASMEYHAVFAAQFARRITEPNSVTFCGIHSGSLRYYGERMTLNSYQLEPQWLDRAVDWLEGRGVKVYALLDESELPEFRKHFAGERRVAILEQPPLGVYQGVVKSLVFDLSRPRASATEPVVGRSTKTTGPAVPPTPAPRVNFGLPR